MRLSTTTLQADGPVAVTFCPLCNTSIVYDRRLDGRVHDFGTTGKLLRSALIMYDRQTETWWWQVSGEAIVGDQTGKRLAVLPSQIISFETFGTVHPRGRVLSRDTGFRRAYGLNPYQGYDDVHSSPFLYSGPQDARLRPMERVATVSIQNRDVAYPFRILAAVGVINDNVGGHPIAVFYRKGVASALDRADIASSRDVGAVGIFSRDVHGKRLTWRLQGTQFVDDQTQSAWNLVGTAVAGPLAGKRLTPIVHGNHFWFAWAAYKLTTRVYQP